MFISSMLDRITAGSATSNSAQSDWTTQIQKHKKHKKPGANVGAAVGFKVGLGEAISLGGSAGSAVGIVIGFIVGTLVDEDKIGISEDKVGFAVVGEFVRYPVGSLVGEFVG